jgi:hypothetical protein
MSEVTMDLPTPPLPDTMPMTFLTLEPLFAGASRLSGLRLEQLALQVEQSWVQFSAIVLIIPFIADIHYYNPFARENQVFSVNSCFLTKICHIRHTFCRADHGLQTDGNNGILLTDRICAGFVQ